MRTYSEYRAAARETLDGRWTEAVVMSLVLMIAIGLVAGTDMWISLSSALNNSTSPYALFGSSVDLLGTILLVGPLAYAMTNALLAMKRDELKDVPVKSMLNLFKGDWQRYVVTYMIQYLVIILISIPTLCIGGIILSYAYKMTPFLLNDYPELSPKEALKLSREMMKGYKWNLFVLDLTFIGWDILAILTCGIGLLWVMPYQTLAEAYFYEDLKADVVVEEE